MKKKIIVLVSVILTILSLIVFIAFPIIKIHVYDVSMYKLERIEIAHINMNFFAVAFKSEYFKRCPIFVIYIILFCLCIACDVMYFKTQKSIYMIMTLIVHITVFVLLASTHCIYSRIIGVKNYSYVREFIDRYPQFPLFFEDTSYNKESVWIDIGLGTYFSLFINGIKIAYYFFVLFFGKRFLNSCNNCGSENSKAAI